MLDHYAAVGRGLIVVGVLGWTAPAFAQGPPDAEPPPKVEGNADLSFVKTTGNSASETLGVAGMITWRPGPVDVELRGQGIRSRTEGASAAESVSLTTRLSRQVTTRVALFAQHDYLHDPFAGLGDEQMGTAGATLTFVDNDEHTFTIDASAGMSNHAGARAKPGAGAILGVHYRWAFGVDSDITHETRWLASLSQAEARRLESTTSLTVGMTSVLSLRLSYAIRRQQTPRPALRQLDTTVSTALVLAF